MGQTRRAIRYKRNTSAVTRSGHALLSESVCECLLCVFEDFFSSPEFYPPPAVAQILFRIRRLSFGPSRYRRSQKPVSALPPSLLHATIFLPGGGGGKCAALKGRDSLTGGRWGLIYPRADKPTALYTSLASNCRTG